jgi:hypothetical protein
VGQRRSLGVLQLCQPSQRDGKQVEADTGQTLVSFRLMVIGRNRSLRYLYAMASALASCSSCVLASWCRSPGVFPSSVDALQGTLKNAFARKAKAIENEQAMALHAVEVERRASVPQPDFQKVQADRIQEVEKSFDRYVNRMKSRKDDDAFARDAKQDNGCEEGALHLK